ncbi:MAG: hypothetical protein LBL58_12475 [Tannerellaceae bacterium]|jgi:hypothetical protein|nr:hypothetical protein [Tannerellaceae bacterium]
MDAKQGLDALSSAGQQILQNSGVQNAAQNLGQTILQGAAGVGAATGGCLLGGGTVASIGTAATSAGAAISTAAASLGTAVLTAAVTPAVIVGAAVGVVILIGVGLEKLFE